MKQPTIPFRTSIIAALTLASIPTGIFIGAVRAHEALPTAALPHGWSYPFACCANYDCRSVQTGEVTERSDGYHTPSGDIVPYGDKRIKDSPDGETHWCAHQAGLDAGKTICLFVPPRGV